MKLATSNGHDEQEERSTSSRKSIHQSVEDLTIALNNLTLRIDTFMAYHSKTIPTSIVLSIIAIIMGVLFGIGLLQKYQLFPTVAG